VSGEGATDHVGPEVAAVAAWTTAPGGDDRLAVLRRFDPAQQHRALLALQQTRGNAATQRWIGPLVQRQGQPAPAPVDLGDIDINVAASQNLPIWADTFANLWYIANNGALGAAQEPADPDFVTASGAVAKQAFGIALAGNLVWAATSLLAPEATIAIRVMSFGGASVGSGILAPAAPASSQPSFKGPAAAALARARDQLAVKSKEQVKTVADECAVNNISDLDEQKKKLWEKMFTTAYNSAGPIQGAAAAKLAAGAASFVAKWQAHKNSKAVKDEAWRRTSARIERDGYPWHVHLRILVEPSGPGGPADEYKLEIFNEEWLKYAAESFQPVLDFT
jgi:hypothetical protein